LIAGSFGAAAAAGPAASIGLAAAVIAVASEPAARRARTCGIRLNALLRIGCLSSYGAS
jgi:hypothetical protein